MRLLVDCDTGIDDALALLWLCGRGHAPAAVTTTAGNSTARQSALNTLAVLDAAGFPDIEVAPGEPGPLAVPLTTTPETHGEDGLGYAVLPDLSLRLSARPWLDVWRDTILAHPGETSLLVTGPLTNLATALRAEPGLIDALADVTIMGGAFHHPGNTTPTAEWNAWSDPHAAAEVYAAFEGRDRLPRVCGLDLTEAVHVTRADVERWSLLPSSPAWDLAVDALRFYVEFHAQWGYGEIAHVPDLVAAMVATGEADVVDVPCWIGVETVSELTRGTTCADVRDLWHRVPNARITRWADGPPDVAVAVESALRNLS